MSQTNNDVNSMNGMFKNVYANKYQKIIPHNVIISPMIPFVPTEKMGGFKYIVPVVVQNEHGVTYGGSGGNSFNYNDAVSGATLPAEVKGNEIVMRGNVSIGAVSRSDGSKETAFIQASKFVVSGLKESIEKKLEVETLYGQMGLGTVASVAGNVITITTAEFAPLIWCGAKGMVIDIRNGATQRGTASIVSVDIEARTITLDSMPLGTTANDVIYERSAYGSEFAGIHKILSNTGSLFEIDAAQYDLWKATTFSAGGAALTLSKIQKAVAKGIGRGLDEGIKLFVNPVTWANLSDEQVAFRKFDSSYKPSEFTNGAESLKFHSQSGIIEIISHGYVKEGYAYGLTIKDWEKVGSTDVTFNMPGRGAEEFFKQANNTHAYELMCYADWSVFCHKPNKQLLITNITNS